MSQAAREPRAVPRRRPEAAQRARLEVDCVQRGRTAEHLPPVRPEVGGPHQQDAMQRGAADARELGVPFQADRRGLDTGQSRLVYLHQALRRAAWNQTQIVQINYFNIICLPIMSIIIN